MDPFDRDPLMERFLAHEVDSDDDIDVMVLGLQEEAELLNRQQQQHLQQPPQQNEDENLPVAIPIDEHRDRRRRRLWHMMARGGRHRRGPPAEVVVARHHPEAEVDEMMPWAHAQAETSSGSSYLMDLIREDLPCSSVLSGVHVRGCSTIVERIRQHPEEVSYRCPRTGRNPLHEATWRCSCRHVIQSMMDSNRGRALHLDWRLNTPLHLLCLGIATRHIDAEDMHQILDLLLVEPVAGTLRNRDGNVPLHCACAAPESMLAPGVMDRLVQACPAAAGRVNAVEQTPLHLHCQRRGASRETAAKLLEAAPDVLHMRDRASGRGYTALHYAAMNGNHPLIAFLLERDPQAANGLTLSGSRTPLHILCAQNATSEEDLRSVRLLLKASPRAALRTDQQSLFTPLHLVCRGNRGVSAPTVQALVEAAPEALMMRDMNNYVPLHHACENGANGEVVACLLQGAPQAASLFTRKNDSPLSLACTANRSVEAVRMLLEAYPNLALQPNDYGFLPLHCSCRAYQAQTTIVQALVSACPESVLKRTNAGESAIHLAGSNTGASVGILDILTRALKSLREENADIDLKPAAAKCQDKSLTSSVGNTPLHLACFRDFSRPHIESLAASNPEWITVRNNAGYSPLQILCKNGRIDDRIVTLFSRLCGPGIFSSCDLMGNTPLHSAMREETDNEALRAIIRAYPEALQATTTYDDTPLHLACLRRVHPDIVYEVALASSIGLESALATCNGRISPILTKNTAGQTPIGIALEEYQRQCKGNSCCLQTELSFTQKRAFTTLSMLTKMLHYGPSNKGNEGQSLVGACVAIHRKGARVDPGFIHRALHLFPEEARTVDEHGNTPLHIEASIPIEKMSLLDSTSSCDGACHKRLGVLRKLLEIHPDAARQRNNNGDFPLNLMIQNGRPWDSSFALVVRTYPQAFHWVHNVDVKLLPLILSRVANSCGSDTLFTLIRSRPEFLLAR